MTQGIKKCLEMHMSLTHAKPGNIFVMTKEGDIQTKLHASEKAITERKIGKPIPGYEDAVPKLWINKGWVTEAAI